MGPQLAPEILAYYTHAPEHERLHTGVSQLEFARTKEIIARRMTDSKSVFLDVGGGPGAYSAWLADLGHEVHLIDPVAGLVMHAKSLRNESGRDIASCTVGDARALDRRDQSVDAVLLLGPLYHLIDAGDRRRALQEAFRVLVPGGQLFAAAISRFASALDGLMRDFFADPVFGQIVERDLADGVHENRTGRLDHFTTAKFHRPDELAAAVEAAGFSEVCVLGIEGPGWLLSDFDDRWRDSRRREDMLRTARALEAEPSIQAASAHLLATAKRAVSSTQ
jgi:ubiquinone/menaquinone biosynthesis C-methylase UbiE